MEWEEGLVSEERHRKYPNSIYFRISTVVLKFPDNKLPFTSSPLIEAVQSATVRGYLDFKKTCLKEITHDIKLTSIILLNHTCNKICHDSMSAQKMRDKITQGLTKEGPVCSVRTNLILPSEMKIQEVEVFTKT